MYIIVDAEKNILPLGVFKTVESAHRKIAEQGLTGKAQVASVDNRTGDDDTTMLFLGESTGLWDIF